MSESESKPDLTSANPDQPEAGALEPTPLDASTSEAGKSGHEVSPKEEVLDEVLSQPIHAPSLFQQRLQITTMSLLLIVLLVHFLREFRIILEPLFIAVFLGYLILPAHNFIVARGMRPLLAGVTLVALIILGMTGLSFLAYRNAEQFAGRIDHYRAQAHKKYQTTLIYVPEEYRKGVDDFITSSFQDLNADENLPATLKATIGAFFNLLTWLLVVFIYLIFLSLERSAFKRRIFLAFSQKDANHVLSVIGKINEAIAQYISVKTFVSFLTAAPSYVLLMMFGVDFAVMWAVLIFLFNYIPYIGSMVAVALPLGLSLVQLDSIWAVILLGVLLITVQQGVGSYLEPLMTGQRLGVSPLLVVIALAFWGLVWGVVGMILAVPLLVVVKIVLDNINATKPVATLMSNM